MATKKKQQAPVDVLDDESLKKEVAETETGPEPPEEQPAADLLNQIEELKEEARASNDKMLRLAADFENTKKRLQRDYEVTLKYAEENLLKDILPSIDNLERAIAQGNETNGVTALLEGVEMTLKSLLTTLEKYGLQPIDSIGKPFDPNFHEALVMEDSDEVSENSVIKEFEKGYLYKDRLLRAAKVVVSKS